MRPFGTLHKHPFRWALAACFCLLPSLLQAANPGVQALQPIQVPNIIKGLASASQIQITKIQTTPAWTRIKLELRDEVYPLGIDLLFSNARVPSKTIFLLPGTGLNIDGSFFVPQETNLAQFLRESGYLVVGITPREDRLPEGDPTGASRTWGLHKHREDIRKAVMLLQSILPIKYDLLGHSMGAVYALDYASHYQDRLDKIVLLDVDTFAPGSEQAATARLGVEAYQQLLQAGLYTDSASKDLKDLGLAATYDPTGDSGVPREGMGLPGNFTMEGLLYFSAIYTNQLPGLTTSVTGLSDNWDMIQGTLAGNYLPAENAKEDQFQFTQSNINTVKLAASKIGSGQFPLLAMRDFYAAVSNEGSYTIDWASIRCKVRWMNTELGYGNQTYAAELIQAGGNRQVSVTVIPGYAHMDGLTGSKAKQEVWPLILK